MNLELIKRFEGCKLTSYLCPAKVPTIGYGSTRYNDGSPVKIGDKITQVQADLLLEQTVQQYIQAVKTYTKVKLNDNQLSALVTFCYNVGIKAFKDSTLLLVINTGGNNEEIKKQFMRWNRGGGKVLDGLTKRREAEYNLYIK